MAKYASHQVQVEDAAHNVVDGATITVRTYASGSPLASIFSDRTGTILVNPTVTDEYGFLEFYAAGGVYEITATKGLFSKTWDHVAIGTASEYDANNLLFAFPLFFSASGKPEAQEALPPISIPLAMTLKDTIGWYARVAIPPAANKVVSVVKNGVEFASISFLIGETEGVFTFPAETELIPGDMVWPIMPISVDAAMATFSLTMLARR